MLFLVHEKNAPAFVARRNVTPVSLVSSSFGVTKDFLRGVSSMDKSPETGREHKKQLDRWKVAPAVHKCKVAGYYVWWAGEGEPPGEHPQAGGSYMASQTRRLGQCFSLATREALLLNSALPCGDDGEATRPAPYPPAEANNGAPPLRQATGRILSAISTLQVDAEDLIQKLRCIASPELAKPAQSDTPHRIPDDPMRISSCLEAYCLRIEDVSALLRLAARTLEI